jgi:hypothetical protein
MGLTVATGYALSDRNRKVHCLISDGEAGEGSIWESLRFIHTAKLDNLHVYANINGMSAYEYLDVPYLVERLKTFLPRINLRVSDPIEFSFAKGLLTHYYVMKGGDYTP